MAVAVVFLAGDLALELQCKHASAQVCCGCVISEAVHAAKPHLETGCEVPPALGAAEFEELPWYLSPELPSCACDQGQALPRRSLAGHSVRRLDDKAMERRV